MNREEFRLRLKLDVLLKEADIFQSEMDKRLDRHGQSFYFCTLLLVGVITGIATFANRDIAPDFVFLVLVFLPFLTTPLAAMFFDDELLRGVSDYHFHQHVAPEIRSVLAAAGWVRGEFLRCTLTSRFEYMRNDLRIRRSRLAATARRIIFLVPFLLAFAALFGALTGVNGYFSYHPVRGITKDLCLSGAIVDCFLLWLTVSMWFSAQLIWRKVTKEPPLWEWERIRGSRVFKLFRRMRTAHKPHNCESS